MTTDISIYKKMIDTNMVKRLKGSRIDTTWLISATTGLSVDYVKKRMSPDLRNSLRDYINRGCTSETEKNIAMKFAEKGFNATHI